MEEIIDEIYKIPVQQKLHKKAHDELQKVSDYRTKKNEGKRVAEFCFKQIM
jgi:hypothetical protein